MYVYPQTIDWCGSTPTHVYMYVYYVAVSEVCVARFAVCAMWRPTMVVHTYVKLICSTSLAG